MGIFGAFARLIGGLLGPVLFGVILDSSCSLWDERCDKRGFCWTYNNNTLSLLVFAAVVAFKIGKLLFYLMAWYFYPISEVDDTSDKLKKKDGKDNSVISSKPNYVVVQETTV